MGKIRNNIKMRVTPEQSRKVQEICFENEVSWKTYKDIEFLDKPFLFIDDFISYMSGEEEKDFLKEENEEVSAELFIRTNGTCVESETPTEDNNKGEQMAELKLECLVEGYEGTYFEIGQVWETIRGLQLKVKNFDFEEDTFKVTLVELEDKDKIELCYTQKGEYREGEKDENDLIKLNINRNESEVPTESTPSEPQPKTLSEYLKENNAYESFVENCVEYFLENEYNYTKYKEYKTILNINNAFLWGDTKEGQEYWLNIENYRPHNLKYDMNEIIFAEVDKRIAEQDSKPESKPKTLSEYLKENNAYETFIENCVERALGHPLSFECKRGEAEDIDDFFVWDKTKQGHSYWYNLQSNTPKPIEYDMNEIVFAEVDKRIAEQKATTESITAEEFNQMLEQNPTKRYMVFVEGKNTPRYIHETKDSAETEARRLSTKEIGCNVFVVEIVKTFKSKVIVEEV